MGRADRKLSGPIDPLISNTVLSLVLIVFIWSRRSSRDVSCHFPFMCVCFSTSYIVVDCGRVLINLSAAKKSKLSSV